jgi:hypothetical protein
MNSLGSGVLYAVRATAAWRNSRTVGTAFSVRSVPKCYKQTMELIQSTPCGGGVECLHRSPARRRSRRKGNPVPGGYKYRDLALQVWGVSNQTVKYGCEFRGTRTWGLRWQWRAATVNDRPILSLKMLHKDDDRKCSVGEKIGGRESRGVITKTNWLAVNRQS